MNSGDFTQTNTCGASVAVGASCTINVTFTPTAAGPRSGTLTINDNASGSPQTVALAGAGEDFTLTVASGSSNSVTVAAGQSATYSLDLTPEDGLSTSVSFACTGAPSEATCSVPSSVTLNGSSASTVTVTVATTAPTTTPGYRRVVPPSLGGLRPQGLLLWLVLLASLAGLAAARRRRTRWALLAAPLFCVLMWVACGGGGTELISQNPGTPAGTYTLTVTGTSTAGSTEVTHTISLTLKVS
jgi:hypothetical protein